MTTTCAGDLCGQRGALLAHDRFHTIEVPDVVADEDGALDAELERHRPYDEQPTPDDRGCDVGNR